MAREAALRRERRARVAKSPPRWKEGACEFTSLVSLRLYGGACAAQLLRVNSTLRGSKNTGKPRVAEAPLGQTFVKAERQHQLLLDRADWRRDGRIDIEDPSMLLA